MPDAAPAPAPPNRGVPLLITAELPADVLAWADALRRAHYPPDRNRLRAHVTLFHALPPSVEDEVRRLLGDLARVAPPSAEITGLMALQSGTAIAVHSPAMVALHAEIAERLLGLLTWRDQPPPRLHITVQNKVSAHEARSLQDTLRPAIAPRRFRFHGFGLYSWHDGLWNPIREFVFRGSRQARDNRVFGG